MSSKNKKHCCCFLGHRKINKTPTLTEELSKTIESLIANKNVNTFLFGSNSEFDDLCHKIVTNLKEKYPYIKRVYVRAMYANINDSYKNYLLESYDDTYYPKKMKGAGKAAYIERNCEMIDKSSFCIMYFDENYTPPIKSCKQDLINYQPKSGTKIAYDYAIKKGNEIINVFTKGNNNV